MDKREEYLNSYDFMRLGQAIEHEDNNAAMMIVGRMIKDSEEAGLTEYFDANLKSIRMCIMGNEKNQAQDILALIIAKRVRLMKEM